MTLLRDEHQGLNFTPLSQSVELLQSFFPVRLVIFLTNVFSGNYSFASHCPEENVKKCVCSSRLTWGLCVALFEVSSSETPVNSQLQGLETVGNNAVHKSLLPLPATLTVNSFGKSVSPSFLSFLGAAGSHRRWEQFFTITIF